MSKHVQQYLYGKYCMYGIVYDYTIISVYYIIIAAIL